MSDESVGLNPQLCWTDVWAFEGWLEQCESGQKQANAANEAVRLYRGNFLPTDVDEPWAAKVRGRLRSKFVRLTEAVGLEEERAGHRDQAIALYLKGLDQRCGR